MARAKTGVVRKRKHNKTLKATKGYKGSLNRRYKIAHEAELHAGQYSYIGRRLRKRDMRKLWIQRINAGLHSVDNGPSYSVFVNLLKQSNIELNRKMLAELATNDLSAFQAIVTKVYGK